ncbi:MAG: hypothetical protein AB3N20_11265 [Rhizobiaceae bacterium]
MSIKGIWTGEMLGPYGWENSGVYVLEKGRILGGSARHYSAGTYSVSKKSYKARVAVNYYGPPRTIFGESQEKFDIEVSGKIDKDNGVIDAKIRRVDKPQSAVRYRMTRRMDVPKA